MTFSIQGANVTPLPFKGCIGTSYNIKYTLIEPDSTSVVTRMGGKYIEYCANMDYSENAYTTAFYSEQIDRKLIKPNYSESDYCIPFHQCHYRTVVSKVTTPSVSAQMKQLTGTVNVLSQQLAQQAAANAKAVAANEQLKAANARLQAALAANQKQLGQIVKVFEKV